MRNFILFFVAFWFVAPAVVYANPTLNMGGIDLQQDFNPIPPSFSGVLKVKKEDGTIVTYVRDDNGDNAADIVGFYMIENASNRQGFDDRVYLSPVGNNDISNYLDKGYTLTQTPGWQ